MTCTHINWKVIMSIKTLEKVWKTQNFIVLDTETTGLGYGSEIVEIAIIDHLGNSLLNTRIRPINGIPDDAAAVHGIRGRDVSESPLWTAIRGAVRGVLTDRDIIIYNAEYDVKMLRSSDGVHKIKESWDIGRYYCAMLAYSEHWGEWNDYHQSWRWQKLTSAMYQQGLPLGDAHSALGDCRMTLSLMNHIFKGQLRGDGELPDPNS